MKKTLGILILLIIVISLASKEYLDLNFFIEPNFDPIDANMVNFLIKNIENDSIIQFNVFAGRTLEKAVPDSVTLDFLNFIKPDLVSPTDFHFHKFNADFNLLMSNVLCDSVPILDRYIIETDSMKIGIFSIYTPDWTVVNDLPEYVELDFNFFDLTKQIAKDLAPQTDFIILLSNLTKYVDKDLINTLPIDVVVSFDYKKTNNEKINRGKSFYYSILTKNGKYGKMRLTFSDNRVNHNWQEVDFRVKQ
ncbi:MAG: hypothetical protein K9N09_11715 [Candidatus Cloacimonetes bacterium]|nr:hypothetical protein [Candidatus Cloacimonadota bacterium]MCF7815132.1 hypothetical protein [Candidatus Cloacimonadota bacterium]MCF7869351.1 hypothetical protein [Candidatus Cloacimonadota bacterium]MCF7884746.1 hypothetical protein [Candidatus Cloacimonadota bacterium]